MMNRGLTVSALVGALVVQIACAPEPSPARHQHPEEEAARGPAVRPQQLRRFDGMRERYTAPVGGEDLLILEEHKLAVASDPSTDAVYIVDLDSSVLAHAVNFPRGARPGRMAAHEDGFFVSLGGSGEVAHVSTDGRLEKKARVCPAPRGIALDEAHDSLWVACASGELVKASTHELEVLDTFFIGPDLRDVVTRQDAVFVSSFRAAEVFHINPSSGEVIARWHAPDDVGRSNTSDLVNSLWRMTLASDGTLLLSYQHVSRMPIPLNPVGQPTVTLGYVGSGRNTCDAIPVSSKYARVRVQESGELDIIEEGCPGAGSLPVDIDEGICGAPFTLFAAPDIADQGNPRTLLVKTPVPCSAPPEPPRFAPRLSAAIDARGVTYILSRGEGLYIDHNDPDTAQRRIVLKKDSPAHLGHILFHGDPGSGLSCAGCHPAGGDDGQPWSFTKATEEGPSRAHVFTRRTQNLRAGVQGRLHWDGEFEDVDALMGDVFSIRMGGFELAGGDGDAVLDWLGQLTPEPGLTPPPGSEETIALGESLYQAAMCGECHAGEALTDHSLHDVGTGGPRKTPTLRGIGQRRRLMSNGCAVGLRQRFICGGDNHGDINVIEDEHDLDALIAYLKTL